MKRIALVCTTIGDGSFIPAYLKEIKEKNINVVLYVIPDKKTAPLIPLSEVIWYPTLEYQEKFLAKFGIGDIIPYNSDNRRNVGYLMALENGNDIIISIDDDNFFVEGSNFFGEHSVVGGLANETTIRASWYNICTHVGLSVYPRGYPYNEKDNIDGWASYTTTGIVAVNEGLWNHDPDFDALTWLSFNGEKPNPNWNGQSFFLGDNTWSPINSQNTAVSREAMVANYFIPMGNVIKGMSIDHHADIFTGYFLEACVKKMKQKIRFGTPIVDHIRNNHDYMEDLVKEYACIQMLEDLTEWLHEEKLDGTTYADCYLSLAERMEDQCEKFTGKIWTVDAKSFIHRTAYCMRRWVKVCKEIGI